MCLVGGRGGRDAVETVVAAQLVSAGSRGTFVNNNGSGFLPLLSSNVELMDTDGNPFVELFCCN